MKPDEMSQKRIQALEELSAHQANTMEEMSAEMAAMAENLRELQGKLDVLTRRLLSVEENLSENPPVTKPPHW